MPENKNLDDAWKDDTFMQDWLEKMQTNMEADNFQVQSTDSQKPERSKTSLPPFRGLSFG